MWAGGGAAAAAYEARAGCGELSAVEGEVVHVLPVADAAVDELRQAGVRKSGYRAYLAGHLVHDAEHPLRADGAVGPDEFRVPARDLSCYPGREPLGQRLAVLDECLIDQDRRTQSSYRLEGQA